jgi:hypothetical protein
MSQIEEDPLEQMEEKSNDSWGSLRSMPAMPPDLQAPITEQRLLEEQKHDSFENEMVYIREAFDQI